MIGSGPIDRGSNPLGAIIYKHLKKQTSLIQLSSRSLVRSIWDLKTLKPIEYGLLEPVTRVRISAGAYK